MSSGQTATGRRHHACRPSVWRDESGPGCPPALPSAAHSPLWPPKAPLPPQPTESQRLPRSIDLLCLKQPPEPSQMSSPSKEELPKVPDAFKNELEKFDSGKMKHAETQEKNPLPSKEDIKQEKSHQQVLKGVSTFNKSKLKRTNTKEKICLPTKEVLTQEKVYNQKCEVLQSVTGFDRSKLRKTKTVVKNYMPTGAVIAQEKEQQAMGAILSGIESFDPAKLKPTETQEKNALPTKEEIAEEKSTA